MNIFHVNIAKQCSTPDAGYCSISTKIPPAGMYPVPMNFGNPSQSPLCHMKSSKIPVCCVQENSALGTIPCAPSFASWNCRGFCSAMSILSESL